MAASLSTAEDLWSRAAENKAITWPSLGIAFREARRDH